VKKNTFSWWFNFSRYPSRKDLFQSIMHWIFFSFVKTFHMKKNELHPELLNINRMKSKPFTKKDFQEISAFIKANKEKKYKQKTGKVK